MINIIENFLIKYKISSCPVIVGFSAGPDSCALALLLNKLKEKYNLNLILAYFNHGWRKEALLEEDFTKDFSKKIGAVSYIKRAQKVSSTEEEARDLRYDFFNKCALKYNSKYVLLAHNKNDNIETLIYRVIKGTSIKGLRAIPEHRDIFFRPLLKIEKKEILEFLKGENQSYMLDSSNNDTKYKRNLIRKEILPVFEKINPKYLNSIENLIINAIQSSNIIENVVNNLKKEIYSENKIIYEKYTALNEEVRLEILNDFIGGYLKYRNRKNLLMYDNFILQNKHSKTSLNADYFLRTRWKKIFIEKREQDG